MSIITSVMTQDVLWVLVGISNCSCDIVHEKVHVGHNKTCTKASAKV